MQDLQLTLEGISRQLPRSEAMLFDATWRARRLMFFVLLQTIVLLYYRFISMLRSPKKSFNLWPVGLIMVTATFFTMAALLSANAIGASRPVIICSMIVSAAIGTALVSVFLFAPDDRTLVNTIPKIALKLDVDRRVMSEIRQQAKEVARTIVALKARRSEIRASILNKREQLLSRN